MSTLRERNRREKWQRIKRAASSLFSERGFEKTTTRDIASRAEVGAGTVYLYARTKEELLFKIFAEEIGAAITTGFDTLPPGSLVDRLVHVFGQLFAFYERDVPLARVLVREMTFGNVELEDNLRLTMSFNQRVAGLLEDAAAAGELRADVPAAAAATNVFGLYLISLIGWLRGYADAPTRDAMFRNALELQIQGLAPREDS